jgi:tRNA pseudouridine13 synthase
MEWDFHDDSLILRFSLPAGAYATSVLRELVDYQTEDNS